MSTDWVAALLMALCGFCFIGALWLEWGNGSATLNAVDGGGEDIGPIVLFGLLPVLGGLIALRQPRNPIGWLLLAGGAMLAVGLLAHAWAVRALVIDHGDAALGEVAAWLAMWLFVPGLCVLVLVIGRFPQGYPSSRWLARLEPVSVVAIAVLTISQAFAPEFLDGVAAVNSIPNPVGVDRWGVVLDVSSRVAGVVIVGFGCLAIIDLVVRVRAAPRALRGRLRWVAMALAPVPLLIAAVALESMSGFDAAIDPTVYIGQGIVLVGVAVAVGQTLFVDPVFTRSRIVDRTLVLVLLSGALAVGYVVLVAVVGKVVSSNVGVSAALAAAAGGALLLSPLRGLLQRRVNRFVFGASVDPMAVVDTLIARLDAADDETTAAAAIVAAIASTTKLPHAAIELATRTVAEHGVATAGATRRFPISRHGDVLGAVVVSLPEPAGELSTRDAAVITHIVRHAGPALHAQKLAADNERSRAEVVVAREAERQQLRRDLHDGIGPSLAGLGLRLDAVRYELNDPATAAALDDINTDLADAVAELRRVTGGLRPPALDELGLLDALETRSQALNACFTYEGSRQQPPMLPAAIEVAIYRIASEALTNVARHARATRCDVILSIDARHVELRISDNGAGLPTNTQPGVGIASMRTRAEELGGTFNLGNTDPGSSVHVTFPLDGDTR